MAENFSVEDQIIASSLARKLWLRQQQAVTEVSN